jgi:TRAP-type uncharacterized transport system substrate-binding protein
MLPPVNATPSPPPPVEPPAEAETPSAWAGLRDALGTGLPFAALALLLLALAFVVLRPNPPRHVVLATGSAQGAYHEFGQRYVKALAAHGITVELRETQGTLENLALLRADDAGVGIAFVQGGADPMLRDAPADDADTANAPIPLVSLGSMFHEPVWLFYREASAQRLLGRPQLDGLSELTGWRVNIGAGGSGVPPLVDRLLESHRVDPAALTLERLPQTPAVRDLLEGRLDAIVLASAPEALMVQMLLQTPGIRLMDFAQAEALSRRHPFLVPVTLPRGVVDLARDLPPADVHLVAPVASLVAREDLHPALVQLFVQAARDVHGGAGWFQRRADFPSAIDHERPLADEAARFYRSGTPWMQRYMPFWLANLVDRMWVVMLSIVAVLIPLSRVVPPLVEFRIRSRVFRWYGQLREIEDAQGREPAPVLLERLDAIDARVLQIRVPLSYADELYSLRGHIQLVRRRLRGEGPGPAPMPDSPRP